MAAIHIKRFKGMPTRMKSVKRFTEVPSSAFEDCA